MNDSNKKAMDSLEKLESALKRLGEALAEDNFFAPNIRINLSIVRAVTFMHHQIPTGFLLIFSPHHLAKLV